MRKRIFIGMAALMVAILITGCGKLPQAEIDQANAAIEEARNTGADLYIPEAFTALQDSMKVAMEEVEGQKSKMMKNYSNAKDMLGAVTILAGQAKEKTLVRIEEVSAEIQDKTSEITKLNEENKQLLTKAPKGKEGTAALIAIRDEITVIETSLNEAKTMVENNDLLGALDKINALKEQATSINTELKEVIAKSTRAR